ncbi:MAG: glycosyltransferase family 9 protein [Ignavibacteria bacterium]|nr:glycosyltransferase family 9 protein [Ignavibacteria bacterium]
MIEKDKIRKILIIKLRGIGDVVLSTIVLENLKTDFPEADIDFLTEKPSNFFLENIPLINEVIIFRKKSLSDRIKQITEIRKRKYDIIFDFYSNPATALLTFFSGAKYRAGFPYKGRNYAYNLKGPEERGKYHAAQLHLEFLKILNLSHSSSHLLFGINNTDMDFARSFIKNNFPGKIAICGISPSGGWQSKKCDADIFAIFADGIADNFNVNMLILWGPGDFEDAVKIKSLMKNDAVLIPETNICKMAAFISQCSFILANDSGPMHISTAVKTPVLSLHGPTSPFLQGPFGDMHEWYRVENLECIECNLLDCNRNHECFKNMEICSVIEKIQRLIDKNNIRLNERN